VLRAIAGRLESLPAPIRHGTGPETREGRHRNMPMTPFFRGEVFFELALVRLEAVSGRIPDDQNRSRRSTFRCDASSLPTCTLGAFRGFIHLT
jgi:hypothetical protein